MIISPQVNFNNIDKDKNRERERQRNIDSGRYDMNGRKDGVRIEERLEKRQWERDHRKETTMKTNLNMSIKKWDHLTQYV